MPYDLKCLDDLDLLAEEVEYDEALLQDHYHRAGTQKGSIIDDPEFGLGLVSRLSDFTGSPEALRSLLVAEHKKDPRILDSKVTFTAIVTQGVSGFLFTSELTTDEGVVSLDIEATPQGVRRV